MNTIVITLEIEQETITPEIIYDYLKELINDESLDYQVIKKG